MATRPCLVSNASVQVEGLLVGIFQQTQGVPVAQRHLGANLFREISHLETGRAGNTSHRSESRSSREQGG